MSDNINFYPGADYGLNPSHGDMEYAASSHYQVSVGDLSLTTDARSANQLKEVYNKINAGVKNIEVQGVKADVLESIPDQHLTEINRLKKLTGMNLTFHGPIVEPTGFSQQGWSEEQREQNEEQMWSALDRSNKLDPNGNIVVTFHSTASLPEMNTRIKKGKNGEETVEMMAFNERSGKMAPISPNKEYLLKEGVKLSPKEEIDRVNKESWNSQISDIGLTTSKAQEAVHHALRYKADEEGRIDTHAKQDLKKYYEKFRKNSEKYEHMLKQEYGGVKETLGDEIAQSSINKTQKAMEDLTYADAHIRGSYLQFQEMFNIAYANAEKDNNKKTISKLNKFKDNHAHVIKNYQEDPSRVMDLIKTMRVGQNVLGKITAPKLYRPMNEFAIDKAADTFSNLAMRSYKKHKDNAPIISIENPPAGGGLSRAEDLRELVKVSRKKFVKNATNNLGMSEDVAKKQAEKLIGITWDVGHINMIKKFGYDDKDLKKETKKIAPYVKHVHFSDNFGMDHTELPMGMGNVPTEKMLKEISKFNKDTRKVIETGNWYQHFKTSPLPATLQTFNSPIYSMQMAPSWNQVQSSGEQSSYFSGYGTMLPENHFNTYGAGFSNLPPELGGQTGGRSRMSGTPIE